MPLCALRYRIDYDVAAQTTQASTEDIVLAELEECLEKLDRDLWVIAEKYRYLNSINPIVECATP